MVSILMIVQSIHSKGADLTSPNSQRASNNSEKKKEFMRLGMTLEVLSTSWSESKIRPYRKALKKFPEVGTCLIAPDNVDSFNWSLVKTVYELEVCLFHIHSYIGDVKQSVEWFRRHGFLVIVQSYFRGDPAIRFYSINSIWKIPSSGPLKDRKSPLSGTRIFFEELFARSGISIGLEINQEGMVTDVSSGYSRK